MSVVDRISAYADDLVALRRDLHAHAEIGFTEERTSNIVAQLLTGRGIEVHHGIGKTGLMGVLQGRRVRRRHPAARRRAAGAHGRTRSAG